MKKIVYMIFVLFLLTGCSVEYNLELKDDTFYEEISFNIPNVSDNISDYNYLKEQDFYAVFSKNGMKEYKKETEIKDNVGIANLSFSYIGKNYDDAVVFDQCFDVHNVLLDDNKYYISTNGQFKCMTVDYIEADKVVINFKTEYDVIDHNADDVNDNIYSWEFNDSNFNNKQIKLVVDKTSHEISEKEVNVADRNDTLLLIGGIIGGILLLALVVAIVIKIFGKANNRV